MKHDHFSWSELRNNQITMITGRVRIKTSALSSVYITQEGHEVLAGTAYDHDYTLTGEADVKIEGPKGTRIFVHTPLTREYKPQGEIYTSLDMRPTMEGNVYEVQKMMRLQKIEHEQQRKDMRELMSQLMKKRRETGDDLGEQAEFAQEETEEEQEQEIEEVVENQGDEKSEDGSSEGTP